MIPALVQRLKYRLRYAWRKFAHFFGFCPYCRTATNMTRAGVSVCPECGKR